MAKRRKIGLIYQYNENWIGGTYYIENLVSALNKLPDLKKPSLFIFTEDLGQFDNIKRKIQYPYLFSRNYKRKWTILQRVANKITKTLFKKNYYDNFHHDIDIVFPAAHEERFKKKQKYLYWIPDFQEHFLPFFFREDELLRRKIYQAYIVEKVKYILFSSKCVQNDFNSLYPGNTLNQFVVRFAVTHPSIFSDRDIVNKYKLPAKFFICNNQFWKHKNHLVILMAIHYLKQIGVDVFVAFTGKEHDYRNPDYFDSLKISVANLSIENHISFLGFIDREDQLSLMKNAIAVIQPSLFEGWSTVVEDSKALGMEIIASDIEVHKEQLKNYVAKQFFSPESILELSQCILRTNNEKDIFKPNVYNYDNDILKFGEVFSEAVETVLNGD